MEPNTAFQKYTAILILCNVVKVEKCIYILKCFFHLFEGMLVRGMLSHRYYKNEQLRYYMFDETEESLDSSGNREGETVAIIWQRNVEFKRKIESENYDGRP